MNTYKQQFVHVKALMALLFTASVLVGTAFAQDANPPWYRNEPHSVHANWHYSSTGDGSLDLDDFWSVDGNPDYYLHGLDVSLNVKGDVHNQYDFQIPNYVDDLPIKYLVPVAEKIF